jgi:hypothetical protein
MVGHLVFAQDNKYVLYGHVPKNWKLLRRGHLYSGKYSIHNSELVQRLQNKTWETNVLLQHTGKDTAYINDWQFMTSRQVHTTAQHIVGLKCYTKDVPAQKALRAKCRLSLEQTFWVLNPLLPPSVHCSDLQFLTCCWPRGNVCLWMHLSVLHI